MSDENDVGGAGTPEAPPTDKAPSAPEWLDWAHDAIVLCDMQGKIHYWNHGAETLYGWSKQQAAGRLIGELLQSNLPMPRSMILEHLQQHGAWEGELRHRTRSGGTVIVSSRWNLRETAEGQHQILEINRDITQQKRVEDAFRGLNQQLQTMVDDLRRTREMFRALIESAPDAMVIIRQGGDIVLINAQTEKMFGYSKEELLGQSMEILIPERFRERHARLRLDFRNNPHVRPLGSGMELFGLRKNGEEFPADISISPLVTDEGLLVSSSIRDISARLARENQLRQENLELRRQIGELKAAPNLPPDSE
ncbi:MAG TPA: PAS domain S-box protein [Bryobacteraceae bacterium]|jgi:protein-histidine pros-kinase